MSRTRHDCYYNYDSTQTRSVFESTRRPSQTDCGRTANKASCTLTWSRDNWSRRAHGSWNGRGKRPRQIKKNGRPTENNKTTAVECETRCVKETDARTPKIFIRTVVVVYHDDVVIEMMAAGEPSLITAQRYQRARRRRCLPTNDPLGRNADGYGGYRLTVLLIIITISSRNEPRWCHDYY